MQVKELRYWLQPKETIFADFDSFVLDSGDHSRNRIFIDRGSLVLLVAHIDTVIEPKFIKSRKTKSGKLKRVYARGLDDRLGCMIAYKLSNDLNVDLLICDNEERCASTGQFHELKEYNWIAEFDREGDDVVTYELDSDAFRKALLEYWEIGFGSFSDIAQLQTTACCMNVGIGVHLSHSIDSYACIKTMNRQIGKFKKFYKQHKDTPFVRDYKQSYYDIDQVDYEYYLKEHYGECDLCGMITTIQHVYDSKICQDCFESLIAQYCYGAWDKYEG